jgi:lysozyme family protein
MLTPSEKIKITKLNAIKQVVEREGGYVNHQDDKGGATNFGVTEQKAREHGYFGSMENYTIEQAIKVYEADFWDRLNLDSIHNISPELAIYLFDFSVNSGTTRAAKHLQRLLNVLNNKGKDYQDIIVDGGIGNNTISTLKQFHQKRGETGLHVLSESLNSIRIAFCIEISESNENQESFTYGWLKRIVEI